MKVVDPIGSFQLVNLPEVFDEFIPLAIDFGVDMVRDLTRGMTQANMRVKRDRSKPHWLTVDIQC